MAFIDLAQTPKTDCPKCFGAGDYPTPFIGFHKDMVTCCRTISPDDKPGQLWGGQKHELTLAEYDNRVAWVDKGIKDDIELLWSHGMYTWVSCEGGNYPSERYIALIEATPEQIDLARSLLPWAIYEYDPGHGGNEYVFRDGSFDTPRSLL